MSQDVKMEWLMDSSILEGADVSMARMTVPAGVTSECHRHSNCTERIHLLTGQIRQRIGEEWIEMGPNETCFVPKNEAHQTENIGALEAVMMICYSAGSRQYESVA